MIPLNKEAWCKRYLTDFVEKNQVTWMRRFLIGRYGHNATAITPNNVAD